MIEYYIALGNVYIYNLPIQQFMGFNPPCEECLIQGMCLEYTKDYTSIGSRMLMDTPVPRILIKGNACENLRKFLKENKSFEDIV
jgi:hypothetical protein